MAAQMLFLSLMLFITLGDIQAHVVPYDHSFTHECLVKPLGPQYGGGIVVNPELKQGLKGWTKVGHAKIEHRTSNDGNNYIVASVYGNRTSTLQNFHLEADKLYAFSAWIQVSHGNAYIKASFKTQTEDESVAGWVAGQQGCWSMLKGGIVVNASGPAQLYFETDENPTSDIWITSVSLQPFTQEEWKSHQDQSVEKVRKGKVKFQVVDERDRPVSNATVSIKQTQPQFPLGNVMNERILENPAYAKWFTSRFKYTVFENELKWTTTEHDRRGSVNYTLPDAMLNFTKSHGLIARGHTVLWGIREGNPKWLANFTIDNREELWEVANSRVNSVMNRYKEQFIHWDVVNENMHWTWLEDILGENASTTFYKKANEIDPKTLLFLNEYDTIEKSSEKIPSPWKYLLKIRELRKQGYNGHLGIGLQSHFVGMSLPYIRASIDVLNSAKLPIWVTELDVANNTGALRQAEDLEQILRELHAHEAVQGIMMWSGWNLHGACFRMCLTDDNFKNLATGDIVDKIIAEWSYATGVQGTTKSDGYFDTSLFYGEYEANINHHKLPGNSILQKFKVVPYMKAQDVVLFKISV
ncbi:hypothetical protein BUALT_Bualt06G0042300 [Buddleja alternifolia]|uniref:GH10 domain-containing protein n=1 Tax=Buddleja alternifolia TaxID=168488 RepID=A0AAV6XCV0_9LAMI|nr:hypothetical protein BUALT_Bualt06G0042300 [Buddleja alternifolia]